MIPKLPSWVSQLNAAKSSTLTAEQQERLENARAYAKEVSVELLERKPQLQAEIDDFTAAQKEAQYMENIGLFCRNYVGSVNYDVLEPHLRAVFGVFGYVTSVTLSYEPLENRHKGFAFVEFDRPEAATTSIQTMDGALLGGRNIKVGRPAHYPEEGNKVLPQAPKTRLYISNMHEVVTEEDLRGIFSPFGAIKAVSIPPDHTGRKHKTYALIDFENVQTANNAMLAMNGFDLGGQPLRVTKAILGGPLPKSMVFTSSASNVSNNLYNMTQEINKQLAPPPGK